MAYQEGDPTAKYAGRLTLNPIAHMDFFGTFLLPLFLLFVGGMFFGYAKPVPINPNNFRDQRRGLIKVSVAGVAANFLIALIFGLGIRFSPSFFLGQSFFVAGVNVWAMIAFTNIWLGLFNLLPVPPLDGSKLLFGLASSGQNRTLDFLRGQGSWFSLAAALLVAFYVLPILGSLIFRLITGVNAGL